MKALKGLLISLIIILVLIISVGGILVDFNHQGYKATKNEVTNENPVAKVQDVNEDSRNQTKLPSIENSDIIGEPSKDNLLEGVKQALLDEKSQTESIDPEVLLQDIVSAKELIYKGNDLIATNPPGSLKANEGIYKLSQGLTLMELSIAKMRKEFKQFRDDQLISR